MQHFCLQSHYDNGVVMDPKTANVPRGMREGLPPRPAMEEDAFERIRREQEKSKEREFVRFAFYKVDAAWRRLPLTDRKRHKDEFVQIVGEFGRKFMI